MISFSVVPFSHFQFFQHQGLFFFLILFYFKLYIIVLASGSFPVSQVFITGGQSIGASTWVLLMTIQDWFTLGLTGLISLKSKGLSRIFSNTVQKHQFFRAQLSLWSNSQSIHEYWKNHSFDEMDLCWQSNVPAFTNLVKCNLKCFKSRVEK